MSEVEQKFPAPEDFPVHSLAAENELPFQEMPEQHAFGATPAPWKNWLEAKIGEREKRSNPWIVALFKHTSYHTTTDATPWCAAAVSSALEETGHKSAHSAGAFAYRHFGKPVALQPGAICVFSFGHVAICHSVGKGVANFIGGNQGDSVKISTFRTSSIIATRWP